MDRWLPGVDQAANSPLPRPDDGNTDAMRADGVAPEPVFDLPLPWALPGCAAFLREAGKELARSSIDTRIAGLARVARCWLDPDDPARIGALEVLPDECGLSVEGVSWGLDRAFEAVNADALAAWWAQEGFEDGSIRLSGHVHAGNVFAAGLPPVIASLLAGVPALIKAPSAAPSFPGLFARSVALNAPELGPCVGAAAWSRADERATSAFLGCVDAVFGFGGDDTIAALRGACPVPVHGFGHRYSVGFVARGSTDLEGLAADVLAWDGAGCLSPRHVLVEGDASAALALATAFAPAMEAAALSLPSGPISEAAGAARASWLGVEGALGWARSGTGWAVSARSSAALSPSPPGRCVAFVPVGSRSLIPELLSPLGARLQGVALVGSPTDGQELRDLLAPLGLSRVAPAGQLQAPEIHWNHDDVCILFALR